MNKIIFLFLFIVSSFSNNILIPSLKINLKGIPQDLVLSEDNIIVANDEGVVENYNYKTKIIKQIISLEKIKDFTGDEAYPSIYSLDYLDGAYLVISDSGVNGFSNMWIYENSKIRNIINSLDKKVIIKAKFINKNEILLGFLGNEVSKLNIKTKKYDYLTKLRNSRLSDFALSSNKKRAVFSSESGIFDIVNIQNGKIIKTPKPIHVDNVFRVSYKKGIISGAGQDRRASIYNYEKDISYYFKAPFLVYNTSLSPSGKLVAFSMDENNNISIFNTKTKEKIAILKGASRIIKLEFKDEKTIVAISSKNIIIWELK